MFKRTGSPLVVIACLVAGLAAFEENGRGRGRGRGDEDNVIVRMCGPAPTVQPGERRFGIYGRDLVDEWNREQSVELGPGR